MAANNRQKILIGDDDANIIYSLKFLLEAEGYSVSSVNSPDSLIELIKHQHFDLLLLDMNFNLDTTSGQEGLNLIKQVRGLEELIPIIMLTGWATVELAVQSLKLGANDFLQKPWDDDRLLHAIKTQLQGADVQKQLRCLSEENHLLKRQENPSQSAPIAKSPAMLACLDQLSRFAKSDMNILLTGENGSGKSLLAGFVHEQSNRHQGRLVSVNMGAISENLFESEMFGHVKGAFTDAKSARVGRFELADGGTLFLDEIANIPLTQQAKLLRVLEQASFEKVGSSKTEYSDARVISATNANLMQMIQDSQFRQDLFYRLNTVAVNIPGLRQRQEDIEPLAQYFLQKAAIKYHLTQPKITENAITALQEYHWPGNVRELSHLMERVLFTATEDIIDVCHLNLPGGSSPTPDNQQTDNLSLTLDDLEKQTLVNRLQHFKGNATKTAKSLGLSRSGWYRRADKFDL